MYNEELEHLIDAALADGVLTEKEKQILFKKAQAMGVDLDEFEMVLDARLVKLQKDEAEKAASTTPNGSKLGEQKRCPNCDNLVNGFQLTCPYCGYSFENISANSSAQKLADTIDKIISEISKRKTERGKIGFFEEDPLVWEEIDRIKNAIKNFPIPSTKSDLFEFITALQTKTSDSDYGREYNTKLKECIIKAKALFPNDKTFESLYTENEIRKKKKTKTTLIIVFSVIAGISLLVLLFYILLSNEDLRVESGACNTAVQEALKNDDLYKAEELILNYRGSSESGRSKIGFVQHYDSEQEQLEANISGISISFERVMDAYVEKGNQKEAKKIYDYYSNYNTPTEQMDEILNNNE